MENIGTDVVEFIETQIGDYDFGRIETPNDSDNNLIKNIIETTSQPCDNMLYKKTDTMKGTCFYIGLGKTGSSTICNSLNNINVFHSHSTDCYDFFYNNILSNNNFNCYDLVEMYSNYYKYKPLIIECIREPISLLISLIGEFSKTDFKSLHIYNIILPQNLIKKFIESDNLDEKVSIICQMFNIILHYCDHNLCFYLFNESSDNNIIKKHNFSISDNFDKNNNYLFKEFSNYSLLILKFENIKNFKNIFNSIGYEYQESSKNLTEHSVFSEIKKKIYENTKLLNLGFNKLKKIYNANNKYFYNFYTEKEMNTFIEKWRCD